MPLYIGIDLGTSGCRAIAIDKNSTIIGEARAPLPPSRNPAPGHYEQDPQDWWEATLAVLDQLTPSLPAIPIDSIAVDGTSATLLLTDPEGNPITPGLMYNDTRADAEARQISALAEPHSGALGSSSALSKLLWLASRHPNQAVRALHQADWISNRLATRWGWSDTNNSLKLGHDPLQQRWPEWIEQLGIVTKTLPRVVVPGTPYGTLDTTLQQRWKLTQRSPIQIISGTTDSVAATLAAGAHQIGDAVTSLGTTLVLKLLSERPLFSPKHGIYSHRIGSKWLISGASNAGGGVLLNHFSIEEMEELEQEMDINQPSGLDYYPLSTPGERFPHADPNYPPRLSPRVEPPSRFLQGMLEGLTRIEMEGYQLMQHLGAPAPHRILSAGGGTNNRSWMALRRRYAPCPVINANHGEAAYGTARLALNRSV